MLISTTNRYYVSPALANIGYNFKMTHFPIQVGGTVQILEILGRRQEGWLALLSNKNLEVLGEKI